MRRKRSAFTLIELLVVIAIIAILAAILFPVFAQAKQAAKATASLSNAKQIDLGILMYSGDVDDQAVLAMAFDGPSSAISFGGNFLISPWTWLITPYVKNGDIFEDPLKGDDNNFAASGGYGFSRTSYDECFSQFGYDAPLLNRQDHDVTTPAGVGTIYDSNSMTSISRPADMVMLAEAASFSDPGYGFYDYGGSGGNIFPFDTVEGPYCFSGCSDTNYGEWFTYPSGYNFNGMQTNINEGSVTGGVAFRKGGLVSGTTNVAFVDGHAKAMTAGALAVGTNWTPSSGYGTVQLTNKDVFRWYQY